MQREGRDSVTLKGLDRLFRPRAVALVGATERSIWSVAAHENLVRAGFSGRIIPVNPKGGLIHGLPAAESCVAAGEPIDAALLMVPEARLLDAIEDLRLAGVAGAVVLSSGFAEMGHGGAERQRALAEAARAAGIRILGPNCLGFVNFAHQTALWTTPLRRPMPNPTIAIVSQSGAIASQIDQFARQQRVAFTHMISTGNEADVTVADVIEYLAYYSEAKAIALFLESVRDPAGFERAVRAAGAAGKPVVVLKVGSSEAAAKAAQAHTGSLVGDDRIFDALCRRLGLTRVRSIEELVITADLLGRQPAVKIPGLALISMSGGLCEIANDQGEVQGVALPALAEDTKAALREALPDFATPNNPLDVTGGAMLDPGIITRAIAAVAKDPNVGMVSFVFDAPRILDAGGFSMRFLKAVGEGFAAIDKPGLMLSHTLTEVSAEGRAACEECGINYSGGGLTQGLIAIGHLLKRGEAAPSPTHSAPSPVFKGPRPVSERGVLDHLARYGVPVIPGPVATSADEAVAAAREVGFPVVLKIASPDIQHKTEVGGVILKLADEDAVRQAYATIRERVAAARPKAKIDGVIVSPMRGQGVELFVGTIRDPQWGPAISVGLGGVFVEALKDVSLRLLPVSEADVLEMLGELRGAVLLDGFRAAPQVDRHAIAKAVVAIGEAALALGPNLVSLEVNPLIASADRAPEALDGLTVWGDDHDAG